MNKYFHFFFKWIVFLLVLFSLNLFSATCNAETFCVSTSEELDEALDIALNNEADDIIKITIDADITSLPTHIEPGFRLIIQGGWDSQCKTRLRSIRPSSEPPKGGSLPPASIDARSTTGPVPPPEAIEMLPQGGDYGGGAQTNILGVPGYAWHHGCGPTALGMVMGFYDINGFSDLYLGDATTQTQDVNQGIASEGSVSDPRHYEDYSQPLDYSSSNPSPLPDKSEDPVGDEHASDSIADFMKTSWSSEDNYYGWTLLDDIIPAFNNYVNLRNSEYQKNATMYYWEYSPSLTFNVLKEEIDANRPMVFLVDSNGDSYTDHFVTVVGYNDSPQQYACLDTWALYDEIRWCDFRGMSSSYTWGIHSGVSFSLISSLIGDINNDGKVDLTDVIISLQLLTGIDSVSSFSAGADVNGDGKIGIEEAIYVLEKVSGLAETVESFNNITLADIMLINMSSDNINGSDNQDNQIPVGTIFSISNE